MNINKTLRAKNLSHTGSDRTIRGIILHDTAGSGTHNDTLYLANPSDKREVSVDFTVERDGTIFQLNPDPLSYFTFHAGRSTSFKGMNGPQVNLHCLGIEIVQRAALDLVPMWPAEQVEAVAQLCLHLCELYSLGKDAITTHAAIITDGSRSDPRKFPFAAFWTAFNAGKSGQESNPLGQKVFYTVAEGDTLYGISAKFSTTIEHLKALNGMNTASNLIKTGQQLLVKE